MRPVFVVPIPLGAWLLGWAVGVGWAIGLAILLAVCFALGFGLALWWRWDALKRWQREKALFGPAPVGVATRNDARPTVTICDDVWVLLPARFARASARSGLPPSPSPSILKL